MRQLLLSDDPDFVEGMFHVMKPPAPDGTVCRMMIGGKRHQFKDVAHALYAIRKTGVRPDSIDVVRLDEAGVEVVEVVYSVSVPGESTSEK